MCQCVSICWCISLCVLACMDWVKSKMLRCQESLATKRAFFAWKLEIHNIMRKGSLQESRGGWRAFKVARLQLEVEQVKNSDPESTLRIHNIAVKLGRKSGMQGGGRTQAFKVARLHLWSWTAVTVCCLKPAKNFHFKALLFPHILGSVDREYEFHGKFVGSILVYFNFIDQLIWRSNGQTMLV